MFISYAKILFYLFFSLGTYIADGAFPPSTVGVIDRIERMFSSVYAKLIYPITSLLFSTLHVFYLRVKKKEKKKNVFAVWDGFL